ncbi:MAG: penicillin acylase family protein, partial [Deltaproteobacteria bacterium]|nr:penicillin acylase family protein [Deltaproteobacteria bacterium]
ASSHRVDRITEMLDSNPKHGIDDLRAQQADVKTRQAALILPIVIAAGNGDVDLANYVDELRSWNQQLSVGSHGGLYYQVFVANFVLHAIRDLSPESREAFLSSVQFNQQTVEAIPRERTGLWSNAAERAEFIRAAMRWPRNFRRPSPRPRVATCTSSISSIRSRKRRSSARSTAWRRCRIPATRRR